MTYCISFEMFIYHFNQLPLPLKAFCRVPYVSQRRLGTVLAVRPLQKQTHTDMVLGVRVDKSPHHANLGGQEGQIPRNVQFSQPQKNLNANITSRIKDEAWYFSTPNPQWIPKSRRSPVSPPSRSPTRSPSTRC